METDQTLFSSKLWKLVLDLAVWSVPLVHPNTRYRNPVPAVAFAGGNSEKGTVIRTNLRGLGSCYYARPREETCRLLVVFGGSFWGRARESVGSWLGRWQRVLYLHNSPSVWNIPFRIGGFYDSMAGPGAVSHWNSCSRCARTWLRDSSGAPHPRRIPRVLVRWWISVIFEIISSIYCWYCKGKVFILHPPAVIIGICFR